MATTDNCIYKTITMQAGEQMVLPPGAVLVGASNLDALTSENDCLDKTNAETLACYAVVIAESSSPRTTPVYDDVVIYGIRIDNVDYPFSGDFSCYSTLSTIQTRVSSTPFNGVISVTGLARNIDGDRGAVSYIVLKTYPSIASDFYFYGIASGMVRSPTSSSFHVDFKVVPYDQRISGGSWGWPSCT